MKSSPFFFDRQDHELLHMVNRILERGRGRDQEHETFSPELHPHGIKELASSNVLRIAYAVINLLNSLEEGGASERILALRSLHSEVVFAADSTFRRNTGRVLIQIMKDLVRAWGDPARQLMLARDFRKAATGKRRTVRSMLRRYHLLEMPESWDQETFDNHVHDANTKGRKTPTHLIMDAWIKGIRSLTVIYYNYTEAHAVDELFRAASIMGITIRLGIEFRAQFRGRFIEFIWEPGGLKDRQAVNDFMHEEAVCKLFEEGRAASAYTSRHVFAMLDRYNEVHRHALSTTFGISLPEISRKEFLAFVGTGQPSLLHLGELAYKHTFPLLLQKLPELRNQYEQAEGEEKETLGKRLEDMQSLHPEVIMETWFGSEKNPELPDPEIVHNDPDLPPILRLSARELVSRLSDVRSYSRVTLTLSGLGPEDVLELLYQAEGRISHLELFNLKDYAAGKMPHCRAINALQLAINQGNGVTLKRLIRGIIRDYGDCGEPDADERCATFMEILHSIPKLLSFYKHRPLKVRIGSDSTSRSYRLYGMGFAFVDTLPASSRRSIRDPKDFLRQVIPLTCDIDSRYTYSPPRQQELDTEGFRKIMRRIPGLHRLGFHKTHDWLVRTATTRYTKRHGSIATLGGFQRAEAELIRQKLTASDAAPGPSLRYLNTTLSNLLKVVIGFALATATFLYTQEWWFLAWFGPLIWFAITGLRNILQAVLGGGGISRTPLLRWNDYVNWSRICDSLLFTGISVPLLELFLRWFLLGNVFGITATTDPVLFFSIISAANGIYLSSHNIYRGLPKESIIGNLLRSVLSVPVSLVYTWLFIRIGSLFEGVAILLITQQASAVISKSASDTVAGIIEGISDRLQNMRIRYLDYRAKLKDLFACFSRLEVLLPEQDVLDLLQKPRELMRVRGPEVNELNQAMLIHALDLMYFWMYKPRARTMLARIVRRMSAEEKIVLFRSQLVLTREKEISQLLVDGLVGQNFARPLAFFLDCYRDYLEDMGTLTGEKRAKNAF